MAASSMSSPGGCDGDGDGAGESFFEPAMFVCESYALQEFTFGPERVVLRTLLASSSKRAGSSTSTTPPASAATATAATACVPAAVSAAPQLCPQYHAEHRLLAAVVGVFTADYDLTGQIVWPGAELLATHLAASPGELAGAAVLELGAGVGEQATLPLPTSKSAALPSMDSRELTWAPVPSCCTGLVGLLCARWCSKVVMTDHNDVVLKVLQSNIDLHNEEVQASGHHQAADSLAVGLYGMHFCSQKASGSRAPGALPPLQRRRPAQGRPSSRMLLAYVFRTRSVDVLVHAEAEARGLSLVELPGTRRKVSNKTLEGLVYAAAVPDLGSSDSADSDGIEAQQH
eukprot:SM000218S06609  [mRNA]  locus=s218:124088:126134:- [translate_table: standard]